MMDNNPIPALHQPVRQGFFTRLLNWFTFGRAAWLAVAALAGAILLLLIHSWRGSVAWERYIEQASARGESVKLESYIPRPVADQDNFAQTPSLAPLYEFLPGTQKWRDTNATSQIMGMEEHLREWTRSKGFEISKNRIPRYEIAKQLDLAALFETNDVKEAADRVPIPSTQNEAARTILGAIDAVCGPMLDELQAASENSMARFNIKYDSAPVSGILLPHLAVIKNRSLLLALRSVSRLALGETNKAFDDLRLVLYLADSFKGEPFIISHLMRLSCRNFAAGVIWQGMADHRWTDAQLRQVQTGFLNDNLPADGYRALLSERACSVRLIDQLRTRAGGTSLSQIGYVDSDSPVLNVAHSVVPAGWFHMEALNLCLCYDRILSPFDGWIHGKQDYRTVVTLLQEAEGELAQIGGGHPALVLREALWKHRLLARMLVPSVKGLIPRTVQAQARVEQIIGACALERFYLAKGHYPETLDALIPAHLEKTPKDPFSGGPMKYRRDADNAYILYSIGPNGKNDGGKIEVDKKGVVNSDEGDLVWQIRANAN